MQSTIKRINAFGLAVMLLAALAMLAVAQPAHAETKSGNVNDNITYSFDTETGVLTLDGTGAMPGSGSANPWCSFRGSIKSVVISNGITKIGGSAFKECSMLESVTIPSTVTGIGAYAFERCEKLEEIVIPESVENIDSCAFFRCESLTKVTLPTTLTSISNQVFYGCTSLKEINFPSKLESIWGQAFYNCSSLKEINIPASLGRISDSAFEDCDALEKVYATDVVQLMNLDMSDIFRCGAGAYINGELLEDLVIPSSLTTVPKYAFMYYSRLKSVTVPNTVTSIGWGAFEHCSGLETISIPNSVTSIGDYAFCDIPSYTGGTIWLPESCELGEGAFDGWAVQGTKIAKPILFEECLYTGSRVVGIENPGGMVLTGDYFATMPGKYTFTATPSEGCTWEDGTTNAITLSWELCAVEMEDVYIWFVDQDSFKFAVPYTGGPITPAIVVKDYWTNTELVEGKDYTVEYTNNLNVGTATVTFTGMGGYTGTATKSFKIEAPAEPLPLGKIVLDKDSVPYNGTEQAPSVKVYNTDGYELDSSAYEVTNTGAGTAAGTYEVEVAGKGYFEGIKKATFTIEKAIAEFPTASSLPYNGTEQVGVAENPMFVISGTTKATEIGTYKATVGLKDTNSCTWAGGFTYDVDVYWTIGKGVYDMSGIKFVNTDVTYDGKAHSIELTGTLPEGVTVSYEGNGQTAIGTYKVKAIFASSSELYNAPASMTAILNIVKAEPAATPAPAKLAQSSAKVKTSKLTAKGLKSKKLKKAKKFQLKSKGVKGKAKVTWKKVSVSKKAKKYIKVYKSGKVVVKKGLKKGTYKLKVKMIVAATSGYKAKTITKTIKVVVK